MELQKTNFSWEPGFESLFLRGHNAGLQGHNQTPTVRGGGDMNQDKLNYDGDDFLDACKKGEFKTLFYARNNKTFIQAMKKNFGNKTAVDNYAKNKKIRQLYDVRARMPYLMNGIK